MGEEGDQDSKSEKSTKDNVSAEENTSKEVSREGKKYCKNCGELIDEKAEICPECGVRVEEASNNNPDVNVNVENANQNIQSQGEGPKKSNKSKVLAGILGIFLGTFGVHKFYLGQPMRAILFILFSWTYIPTLIGIIQGISYLFMSEQKFAQKFG